MAGRKITQLPTLTTPAATDKLVIVDVSDTSESTEGTSKQIAFENLGITSIESDTLDVTIDEGVATVDLPYEAIPLSGTEEDKPLTGNIVVEGTASIRYISGGEVRYIGYNLDGEFGVTIQNQVAGTFTSMGISNNGSGVNFTATDGTSLGNIGLQLTDGEYSFVVNADKIGIFDKATNPSQQAAAIADATNGSDVITQLNTLLAAMRAYGLIAE